MKSTVERLSATRVRINVEVPFDELKPDFDRAYKKIAKQVKIPGFRPGKAPARILEARLGRDVVLDEVVNGAIPAKYSEAVSEKDVTPIGRPDIEVTEIADGEHLSFTAEVDVRPDLTLPDLDQLTVTVDTADVTDEQVTQELDNLRARFGTLTGVERAAGPDDFVLIDLSATVGGKVVEEAQTSGFSYQVGQGNLIEGLDDAITGLSAGESATFTTELVAGDYAGKDAEVTVTVTAVKERDLPDADDEFAQLASEFDTLDELVEDLRARLVKQRVLAQAHQARDRLIDSIVDATEVPLPESVVEAEVHDTTHNAIHRHGHDEARFAESLAAKGKTREEFDAETRAAAEKSVRSRLVLDALADAMQTAVSDRELTDRVITQAQQYGVSPEDLIQRIQDAGQLGAVYADLRRNKTVIAAMRVVTIVDTAGGPVDLTEVLGPGEQAAEPAAAEAADTTDSADSADPTDSADSTDNTDSADSGSAAAEEPVAPGGASA